MRTSVFVADDHAILRDGLATLLAAHPDMEVVGTAANGREAVAEVLRLAPRVAIRSMSGGPQLFDDSPAPSPFRRHFISVGDHRLGTGSDTSAGRPRDALFYGGAASAVGTHLGNGRRRNHAVRSESGRDEQRKFHRQFCKCPRSLFRKHADRQSY